jgi:Fe-S cluster biogenesis protein NfuA
VRSAAGYVLRFSGVCGGCPAARYQHRDEIESFLKSRFPSIRSVVIEPWTLPG